MFRVVFAAVLIATVAHADELKDQARRDAIKQATPEDQAGFTKRLNDYFAKKKAAEKIENPMARKDAQDDAATDLKRLNEDIVKHIVRNNGVADWVAPVTVETSIIRFWSEIGVTVNNPAQCSAEVQNVLKKLKKDDVVKFTIEAKPQQMKFSAGASPSLSTSGKWLKKIEVVPVGK